MKQEGLTEQEARSRFWLIDKDGLLYSGRKGLDSEQDIYAQPESRISGWPRTYDGQIGLADVIGMIDATILIGLSTVSGAFSEPLVREMARKVERPIIFPAIGLGVVASRARRVTESMMLAAARELGRNSPALKDASAPLLPPLRDLRRVAVEIAFAVGVQAQRDGIAAKFGEDELRQRVLINRWAPAYAS
jgi:malate dehydrogenase (oxaloacetate-decarboxylating)